ncbi:anti-sigma factor [Sphingomonas sp.]|uniref:anti-sigma factor n=1 Tax=Sphingomonas sp. TaxID=28214 RepID=UPI00286D19A9|nr:anti-sigma factor [Sphingomonas sp.]
MTDEQEFYAWLDGELDAAQAERVAARVAADPALAALASQHRALGSGLRAAFAPVIDQSPPAPSFGATVIHFQARRDARPPARQAYGLPQWAAIAATLVVGLVAGQLTVSRSDAPIETRGGAMVASASLDRALDARLASAGEDGPVRVGLTFRDREGAICRSFTGQGASGLACRADDDWRVQAMFAAAAGQGAGYRMAAGDDPRLASLIDERISGEPFDAAAEKAARDRGWR